MNSVLKKSIFIASLAALGSVANAQFGPGWVFECDAQEDPPVSPYSQDWGRLTIANDLFRCTMGVSGTVTYGGDPNQPCYANPRTLAAPGRFAFSVGPTGSVQTDFDDNFALTFGAPFDAAGDFCYMTFSKGADGTDSAFFGDGGLRGFFVGASRRYMVGLWNDADLDIQMTMRCVGDAGRLEWRVTNLNAATQRIGFSFAVCAAQRTVSGGVTEPNTNYSQFNSLLVGNTTQQGGGVKGLFGDPGHDPTYIGYTASNTFKPVRTERCYLKDNPKFPPYLEVSPGQSVPYGLRVQNITTDEITDQTPIDQILIGEYGSFTQPGLIWDNAIRTRVFLDNGPDPLLNNNPPAREEADILLSELAFIQRTTPIDVISGGTRTFVNYVRTSWSVGDYFDPFTVVVDAPRLIAAGPGAGTDDLSPNPFVIRAYLDNQYAQIDREVTLNDTRVTIILPPGLTRAAGEPQTKVVSRILPNEVAFVEWNVIADGNLFGNFPVTVRYETVPGPQKNIVVNIPIAATPRLNMPEGPSLVAVPWQFPDTSLDAVFAPLLINQDYQAWTWNPDLASYVPATSVQRTSGFWVVPTSDLGYRALNNPVLPADTAPGGLLTNLQFGWNLIGNPYNYPIQLSTLVAVAQDNPADSFTFQDLINLGYITPSLAYWQRDPNDPATGSYRYTVGVSDFMQPNTGYWIYVSTVRPIRLVWPGVFTAGLPNSGRGTKTSGPMTQWPQSERRWRLQLSAQTTEALDEQNYVGVAGSMKDVNLYRVPKPPLPPQGRVVKPGKVEVSIEDTVGGKSMRMAQTFIDKLARREWKVFVRTEGATDVNLTWPNLTTIPKNVRLRITDKATNTSRDLRSASGYSFHMSEAGTREFTLLMEPGGATRAVIGNVVVTRPSKDKAAPFTINYNLSSDASTTIRILSGTGKEVFSVSRGRADSAGSNTATWAMRDNANRAVAPGTYRVEILAETVNGERVRKIVPINVVR